MDTRHLVDPELAATLEQFPPLVLTPEILPQVRAISAEQFAQMRPLLPTFPEITVDERRVPGLAGEPEVRVLVYRPQSAGQQLPALLWIHGGGYVLRSADQDEVQAKSLATAAGCVVVSVDYRLAPETPYPGPVEDCYAALAWLHAKAAELSVDPHRIAIGGASAGGGLAAGLGLLARTAAQYRSRSSC